MITATVKVKGLSPIAFGRFTGEPKKRDESYEDYEERIWPERCHCDEKENVYIPPSMWKNSIAEAAKYRSEKIQGKGNATYSKHFDAGLMVTEPTLIGIKKNQLKKYPMFVPLDGKRGGSVRGMKNFPITENWEGTLKIYVLDPIITKDVLERHLKDAGQFIGIGSFRPRNRGWFGRFDAEIINWK